MTNAWRKYTQIGWTSHQASHSLHSEGLRVESIRRVVQLCRKLQKVVAIKLEHVAFNLHSICLLFNIFHMDPYGMLQYPLLPNAFIWARSQPPGSKSHCPGAFKSSVPLHSLDQKSWHAPSTPTGTHWSFNIFLRYGFESSPSQRHILLTSFDRHFASRCLVAICCYLCALNSDRNGLLLWCLRPSGRQLSTSSFLGCRRHGRCCGLGRNYRPALTEFHRHCRHCNDFPIRSIWLTLDIWIV